MRNLFLIAAKDLRLRIRDRSVFIIAFIAPLVLAFIFNAVFGSVFSGDAAFQPALGIVAGDSPRTAAVLEEIALSLEGSWQTFATRPDAQAALKDGEVEAVFVVPEGFDDGIDQGRGGSLEVLGDVDASLSRQIADSVASGYALNLDQIRLAIAVALESGGDPATVIPAATSGSIQPLAGVGEVAAEVRQLDGTTATVAGMSVFFLMFTAQVGLLSLLEERRDGTLARILSTPTRPWSVLGAKALVSVVFGVASLLVLIVAGRLIMGARWGDPWGVGALVLAAVLAAVGISALTTGMARTPEAAGNIQGVVGTVLGLLGGVFFPIGEDGGILAGLSALTPHHWFMRGLADLSGGQGPQAALPATWPLLLIALGSALAAAAVSRRQLSR